MRVVVCDTPHFGGTFRFYRNLRDVLASEGHEVFCVAAGSEECAWIQDPLLHPDPCEQVAADVEDPAEAARRLVAWVARERIQVLLPQGSRIALSAVPYLPETTAIVPRCNNITRTYRSKD